MDNKFKDTKSQKVFEVLSTLKNYTQDTAPFDKLIGLISMEVGSRVSLCCNKDYIEIWVGNFWIFIFDDGLVRTSAKNGLFRDVVVSNGVFKRVKGLV